MNTSIIGITQSYNGGTGLFIERLHLTYGRNPLEAVQTARKATTLESGWEWMIEGMGRPALKSIAKVANADGSVICSPEIKAAAIAYARKAGEDALANYLEAAK